MSARLGLVSSAGFSVSKGFWGAFRSENHFSSLGFLKLGCPLGSQPSHTSGVSSFSLGGCPCKVNHTGSLSHGIHCHLDQLSLISQLRAVRQVVINRGSCWHATKLGITSLVEGPSLWQRITMPGKEAMATDSFLNGKCWNIGCDSVILHTVLSGPWQCAIISKQRLPPRNGFHTDL